MLRILCATCGIFGTLGYTSAAEGTSILVGDIEYTRDGQVDETAGEAVNSYLDLVLSRLGYGGLQRKMDYIRACVSASDEKTRAKSCSFPDYIIQLQVAERAGEVQLSGVVSHKTDTQKLHPHTLPSVRVKIRDLPDGLAHLARSIEAVFSSMLSEANRTRVIITCFAAAHRKGSSMTAAQRYASELPLAVQVFMRERPRINTLTHANVTSTECQSHAHLATIAKAADAEAVLTGRVSRDDNGLTVVPTLFIVGVRNPVDLPSIRVTNSRDKASYTFVARKIGAVTTALITSSDRDQLIDLISRKANPSYYVAQAKEHLLLSPPDYDTADTLLELALADAPAQQQPYILRASSLTDRSRFEEAAKVLRTGLERVPVKKQLYAALAENEMRAGDLKEARRVYTEALSANILAEEALLGIATTYLLEGSSDLAMKYAKWTIDRDPKSIAAHSLAGQIADGKNDFQEAERYYQAALRLAPSSTELISRLSRFYSRWASEDLRRDDPSSGIAHLSASIELQPSIKTLYDRAGAYLVLYSKSGERAKGYEFASKDFSASLEIARSEKAVVGQFPWLMPNLMEVLIFEGKFQRSKGLAEEFFVDLANVSTVKPYADLRNLRLIASFLNATAEILESGSADRELYLFENSALGVKFASGWSFADMLAYLDAEYPRLKPQLRAEEREYRVATVKRLITRLSEK